MVPDHRVQRRGYTDRHSPGNRPKAPKSQGGASITVNEALTLSGSGVFNALGSPTAVGTTSPLSSGGLRNISGNNILTGNVTIGATNTSLTWLRFRR